MKAHLSILPAHTTTHAPMTARAHSTQIRHDDFREEEHAVLTPPPHLCVYLSSLTQLDDYMVGWLVHHDGLVW